MQEMHTEFDGETSWKAPLESMRRQQEDNIKM